MSLFKTKIQELPRFAAITLLIIILFMVYLSCSAQEAWGNKAKGGIHAEVEPVTNMKGIIFIASTQPISNSNMSIKNKQLKLSGAIVGEVEAILGTKRKVDFEGLASGTTYYIAAVAFNAAGPSDISQVIDVVAP